MGAVQRLVPGIVDLSVDRRELQAALASFYMLRALWSTELLSC